MPLTNQPPILVRFKDDTLAFNPRDLDDNEIEGLVRFALENLARTALYTGAMRQDTSAWRAFKALWTTNDRANRPNGEKSHGQ